MPAEDDIALDEKRVFDEAREETVAWVASPMGVTRVSVAGAQIGRFTLAHACDARDLAAADGRLYVATDEDVLVGTVSGFEPSGFGPAVAVGIADGRPLAAGPDGTVAALEGNDWDAVGTVPSDVRRIDGSLVAAADGIYHVAASGVTHAGLDDARDVADTATGAYAATAGGLYLRQDGWTEVLSGAATVVAAGAGQAHAVVEGTLRERAAEHTWPPVELPVAERVTDVASGERAMAVTGAGTLLVAGKRADSEDGEQEVGEHEADGWRHRALGVADAAALAVA